MPFSSRTIRMGEELRLSTAVSRASGLSKPFSFLPIRIVRDEKGMSLRYRGIYPAGEGAGYAGGIVSAAVDGILVAEKIAEKYGWTK